MIILQLNKKDLFSQWIPFGIIILISFVAYPLITVHSMQGTFYFQLLISYIKNVKSQFFLVFFNRINHCYLQFFYLDYFF